MFDMGVLRVTFGLHTIYNIRWGGGGGVKCGQFESRNSNIYSIFKLMVHSYALKMIRVTDP